VAFFVYKRFGNGNILREGDLDVAVIAFNQGYLITPLCSTTDASSVKASV
jgi:hypothetical protein